ncbi:MAG: hypothetical protein ACRC4T_27300 [Cetobacterium sp.]
MKVKNIIKLFVTFTFISNFILGNLITEDDLIILDKKQKPAKLDIEVKKINSVPLQMKRNRAANKILAEVPDVNNNLIFLTETLESLPISGDNEGRKLLNNLKVSKNKQQLKGEKFSLVASNLQNGNKKLEITEEANLDSLYVYVVDEKNYDVKKVYRAEFIDYVEPLADYYGEFTLNPNYAGYKFENEEWFYPVKSSVNRPWLNIQSDARYAQNINTTQLKYVNSGEVIASNISYNSTSTYLIKVGTSTISMKFGNDNPAGTANYNKPTYKLLRTNYSGYAGSTQVVYVAANGNSYYQTINILGEPLNLIPTIDENGLNFGNILKYSGVQNKVAQITIGVSGVNQSISSRLKMRIKGNQTSTEIQKNDSIGSSDPATKILVSNLKLAKIDGTTDFNLSGTLNFKGTEQAGDYRGNIIVEAYIE